MRSDQATHLLESQTGEYNSPKQIKFQTILPSLKAKQQFENLVLKTEIQQFIDSATDQNKLKQLMAISNQQRYKFYQISIENINKFDFLTLTNTTYSQTFKIDKENTFQMDIPDCQQISLIFQKIGQQSIVLPIKLEIGCDMYNDMKIMISPSKLAPQLKQESILYVPIQLLFSIPFKFSGTLQIINIKGRNNKLLRKYEITNEDINEFNADEFLAETYIVDYDKIVVLIEMRQKLDIQGEQIINNFDLGNLQSNEQNYYLFTIINKQTVNKATFIQQQNWYYGKLNEKYVFKAQLKQQVPLFIQQDIQSKINFNIKELHQKIETLDNLNQNEEVCQQLDQLYLFLLKYYQVSQSESEKLKFIKTTLGQDTFKLENILFTSFNYQGSKLRSFDIKIISKINRLYQLFLETLIQSQEVQNFLIKNQKTLSDDEVVYLFNTLQSRQTKEKLIPQLIKNKNKQILFNTYFQYMVQIQNFQLNKSVQTLFIAYKKQRLKDKIMELEDLQTLSNYLNILTKDDSKILTIFTNSLFDCLKQIYEYQEYKKYQILYSAKQFFLFLNSKIIQQKQSEKTYKFQIKINSLKVQLQEAFYLFFIEFPEQFLRHQQMIQYMFVNRLIKNTFSQNEINFMLKLLQNKIFYIKPVFDFINKLDTQIFIITYFDNVAVINSLKQTNIENYVEKLCILFADTVNPGYLDLIDKIDDRFQFLPFNIQQIAIQHIIYKPGRLQQIIKVLMGRQTKSQIGKSIMIACTVFHNSLSHINKLDFNTQTLIQPQNIIVIQEFIDLLIKYKLSIAHYYLDCLIISYIKNNQVALAIATIEKKIELIKDNIPDILFLIQQIISYRQFCITQSEYTYYPNEYQYCNNLQAREFIKLLKQDPDSWHTYLFKVDINSISRFLQLQNQSYQVFDEWITSQMQLLPNNIVSVHCGSSETEIDILDKLKTQSICNDLPYAINYFQEQITNINTNVVTTNENIVLFSTISGNQITLNDLKYNQNGFQQVHILLLNQIILHLNQYQNLYSLQNEIKYIQNIDQTQLTDLYKCFFPSYRPYFEMQKLIDSVNKQSSIFIVGRLVQLEKLKNGYVNPGLYIQNISSNLINIDILSTNVIILNQYIIARNESKDKYVMILDQQITQTYIEYYMVKNYHFQKFKNDQEINSFSIVLFKNIINSYQDKKLTADSSVLQFIALQNTYLQSKNKEILDEVENITRKCINKNIKEIAYKMFNIKDQQKIQDKTDQKLDIHSELFLTTFNDVQSLTQFSNGEQSMDQEDSTDDDPFQLPNSFIDGKGVVRQPAYPLTYDMESQVLNQYDDENLQNSHEVEIVIRNREKCYKILVRRKENQDQTYYCYYYVRLMKPRIEELIHQKKLQKQNKIK